LIWSVFHDFFVKDDGDGSVEYVYHNHDDVLSLQLFNVEALTEKEIKIRVNEILLNVSSELGMDFKLFSLNPQLLDEGDDACYTLQFKESNFEDIPALYLLNAISTDDARLSYLSYYHVMEYFFIRAQNMLFLNEFSSLDMTCINHNELRKVLQHYKSNNNERSMLKQVLSNAVDIPGLRGWVRATPQYSASKILSHSDLTMDDSKIINHISNKIYALRCSIAHAKGDSDEAIIIPIDNDSEIAHELPLIKHIAFDVISYWSRK